MSLLQDLGGLIMMRGCVGMTACEFSLSLSLSVCVCVCPSERELSPQLQHTHSRAIHKSLNFFLGNVESLRRSAGG